MDDVQTIAALIAAGDDALAFGRLQARLAWPAGRTLVAAELPAWFALVGELAARRGADDLAEIAEAAARDAQGPDRLYDLGYALIDAGAPAMAASVLWRCLELVPDSEEIVCELVSALESALQYRDALGVLEQHPGLRARSFMCRYLYAFNGAMAGQLAITRAVLDDLVPEGPEAEALHATIAGIVARADRVAGACPLDERDLRGWQYVLTGCVVSHLSPYGLAEPMRGRYAWLQDSHARIAFGLDRLAELVAGRALPCIYAPPGRDHEILARAASLRLGLPIAPWPAVGVPAPGLVVVYDLAQLAAPEVPCLIPRRADQVVFAHGSPWTVDSPLAADVTTLLAQSLVAPWAASIAVDPATGQAVPTAADDRSPEVIAAEIVASGGLDAEELAADERARWEALIAAAWPPPAAGTRSRLWAGGPVPSSRFV